MGRASTRAWEGTPRALGRAGAARRGPATSASKRVHPAVVARRDVLLRAVGLLVLGGLLAGCGDSAPPAPPRPIPVDSRAALTSICVDVVAPEYAALVVGCESLRVAVTALAEAPDAARLARAQQAWREAREPWLRSLVIDFGPVKSERLGVALDFWPTRPKDIEKVVQSEAAIDSARVAGLGVGARGFHALEYLLFDPDDGDEEVLAMLGQPAPTRYAAMARGLAEDLVRRAAQLEAAWRDHHPALVEFGTPYVSERVAFDNAFRNLVFAGQDIVEIALGKPMGISSGGDPRPKLAESFRSRASLAELRVRLAGLRAAWRGGSGEATPGSLAGQIAAADPALAADVAAAFAALEAALAAIPEPLEEAVHSAPEVVAAAYRDGRELLRLLAVDVAGALGVSAVFGDNDGD